MAGEKRPSDNGRAGQSGKTERKLILLVQGGSGLTPEKIADLAVAALRRIRLSGD